MSILVAMGGATHSTMTVTFAAYLAALTKEQLTILTVIKDENQRHQAEAILESVQFVLAPLNQNYHTLIRVGHSAEELLLEAEQNKYTMIVVADKQKYGLFTRFLIGSTALRVIEHAPCPVVIVKGHINEIKRLLICDSGKQVNTIVEKMTAQLPRLLSESESITVLHVMSQILAWPGLDGQQLRADAEELIEQNTVEGEILAHDVNVFEQEGYHCQPKVRHGRIVDEVLAEADEGHYNLVVIGAHHGAGWRRILLDDMAQKIINGLERPILVLR